MTEKLFDVEKTEPNSKPVQQTTNGCSVEKRHWTFQNLGDELVMQSRRSTDS